MDTEEEFYLAENSVLMLSAFTKRKRRFWVNEIYANRHLSEYYQMFEELKKAAVKVLWILSNDLRYVLLYIKCNRGRNNETVECISPSEKLTVTLRLECWDTGRGEKDRVKKVHTKVRVYIEEYTKRDLWKAYLENSYDVMVELSRTFLSTGLAFRSLAYSFRMSHSTIRKVVYETCSAIWKKLHSQHLPRPTKESLLRSAMTFYDKWNFPNCAGCIDGKHIRIICIHIFIHTVAMMALVC
ncbi:hypothetical protein NQ318_009154 [Aromia moschata]|uniref:Transposase n=1 Tax=Aromia moschata TaxID=1265417 RepID=A0AAV8XI37_9CUCU|nr:hypothetical protein NQ318_009154 [Aromia moschata]